VSEVDTTSKTVDALRTADTSLRKAKDILRAARLALLPATNLHVKADLAKIAAGKKLSPILFGTGEGHRWRRTGDRGRLPPRLCELPDRTRTPRSPAAWCRGRAEMTGFGFGTLALLVVVGLIGPMLASVPRLRGPVGRRRTARRDRAREDRSGSHRPHRSDLRTARQHRLRPGDVRGRNARARPRRRHALGGACGPGTGRTGRCGRSSSRRGTRDGLRHRATPPSMEF